jgi:transcriptional regulator with XRE-family HTH domain
MRDQGRAVRTRVGTTIRQLRELRGWSQEKLAERAKSSAKHIGQIERGHVDVGLNRLTAIANALSVRIGDLFVEPRGRRSARSTIHVITGEDVAHLDHICDIVRRIKSPRARPSSRSSR